MDKSARPVIIKKYATRRLYNTATSEHITLDDLAAMAKGGDEFIVYDATTGEDITRVVLLQIIVEQEKLPEQNMLPLVFLRQLIRLHGDGIELFVRRYLELTLDVLSHERGDD